MSGSNAPRIKAIETSYAGCRFRSRLEARWAVFFDALGITWEYEAQGFTVGTYNPRRYLPDFWLPETETWVEVKGSDTAIDWDFLADACDYESALPGMQDSQDTSRGLLLLGPIPANALLYPWRHIGVQHYKGVVARYFEFCSCPAYPRITPGPYAEIDRQYADSVHRHAGVRPVEYPSSPGYGEASSAPCWSWRNGSRQRPLGDGPPSIQGVPYSNLHTRLDQKVADAYAAARSARFEHGQRGSYRRTGT